MSPAVHFVRCPGPHNCQYGRPTGRLRRLVWHLSTLRCYCSCHGPRR